MAQLIFLGLGYFVQKGICAYWLFKKIIYSLAIYTITAHKLPFWGCETKSKDLFCMKFLKPNKDKLHNFFALGRRFSKCICSGFYKH
jgi:hypothetical protein